ncbi:siderophore ABC transporter substrate-binding protein [Neisseria montereyensis]|uniref:Siderophore ABC transporter substrate-binding protein n=1 Tax=Neisseria montereyensis TaxID=2973938 RepID=A0ABT2FCA4_9NEIS|nr:siderophore ABC transporter substrate-binding protein [Neisseria montereyensis]MCS4533369.1 siderophore ABC transporter substrate-binding protein [Neisseria montereyensis]
MMSNKNTSKTTNHFVGTLKSSLVVLGMLTLFGCSQASESDNAANGSQVEQTADASQNAQGEVTIHTARGDVSVAANPHPVAVYDMTILQNLSALNIPVEGMPGKLLLENLKAPNTPESKDIGTVFEPNLEVLNEMQPKAIFVGSRMAKKYDELSKVAPTFDLTLDTSDMYQATKQQLADLGKLFNKESEAKQLQQNIDDEIAKAKAVTEGKGNALIILVNGNKIAALSDKSRFGFVNKIFNIPAADPNIEDARHGEPVSFEYVQKIDPDWLFVLDRTSAVGQEGDGAEVVLDNPLIHQTKAWKNGHILYLSPDSYLAFGGYYQWMQDTKMIAENFAKASKIDSNSAQ